MAAAAPRSDACPSYREVPYGRCIVEAERRHGIPRGLLAAVIHHESGFHCSATSKAGARGLAQLLPDTARELGLRLAPRDERTDPRKSIGAGARYLRQLLDAAGGNVDLALAGYNSGPVYVALWGAVPPPARSYVRAVRALEARYRARFAPAFTGSSSMRARAPSRESGAGAPGTAAPGRAAPALRLPPGGRTRGRGGA